MRGEHFHSRHEGIFDPSALEDQGVLIVGVGSVGSEFARLLARSGVRRFHLVDPDTVSATNLTRSTYVAADVGGLKVDALRAQLTAICGRLDIRRSAVRVDKVNDQTVRSWLSEASIVIAATDHPPTQARLGALSYGSIPAVFPGVYALGSGGEVIWTTPRETPCYACILGTLRGASEPPRPKTNYGAATAGQLVSEPALGIDILNVTVCAAKIALALLLRKTKSRVSNILDPSRSVLFVGNEVGWLFQEPFETVWARATRRDNCPCRLEAGQSSASLFTKEELAELAASSGRK